MLNNTPTKPVEEMTPEELYEFRNSLDPETMGFEEDEEGVNNAKNK